MLKIVSNYNLKFLNYFRINLSIKIFLDVFFYKRILMLKWLCCTNLAYKVYSVL